MRHPWNAYLLLVCFISSVTWARADENLESLKRDLESLRRRVEVLEQENGRLKKEIDVDRRRVREELVVSDTGQAWSGATEPQQIPRGIYARSLGDGPGGLWVRSRLIKGEIDDPFDDRFHALEANGSLRRTPGHISWNIWVQGAWRQMSIIQGESLEPTEMAPDLLTGKPPWPTSLSNVPTPPSRALDRCPDRAGDDVVGRRWLRRRRSTLCRRDASNLGRKGC